MKSLIQRSVAEFIGTFGLVFAGTGAVVINQTSAGSLGHVGIALTFGLVIAAMIFATGHISGAHINPAVTLAFWSVGRFPNKEVPFYVVAQVLGACAASVAIRYLIGDYAYLGATIPSGSTGQSLGVEFFLTFFLMFVIMGVATDARANGAMAAIAIGITVGFGAMFAGPISGASMNPARSFGPAFVGGFFSAHWIYWVGPIAGSVFGAWIYDVIRCDPKVKRVYVKGCC